MKITVNAVVNCLLVMTCIVTCVDIGRNYILSARTNSTVADLASVGVGKQSPLTGQRWIDSDATVVFAVSRTCHFCAASAPFYHRLIQSFGRKAIATIAIAPDPEQDIRAYLEGLDLPIERVQQVTLKTLNIRATPTLEVVDRSGNIVAAWVGQLSRDQEEEVLRVVAKQGN
jgi:thiol-disulfide isomerase/thioredoxin